MARASLKDARYFHAKARADDVLALADDIAGVCDGAPGFVLKLSGRGPTYAATGAHAELLTVAKGGGDEDLGRIRVEGPGQKAEGRGQTGVAWASTFEATHVGKRRFDDVLAERARFKGEADEKGRADVEAGRERVLEGAVGGDRAGVVNGAVLAGVGVGMFAMSAATDSRVDVRFVQTLPERVEVVRRAPTIEQ